jgi:hypothetical protein
MTKSAPAHRLASAAEAQVAGTPPRQQIGAITGRQWQPPPIKRECGSSKVHPRSLGMIYGGQPEGSAQRGMKRQRDGPPCTATFTPSLGAAPPTRSEMTTARSARCTTMDNNDKLDQDDAVVGTPAGMLQIIAGIRMLIPEAR